MLEYTLMILSGFVIGVVNYAIMKYSINKLLMTQKASIAIISFFGRNIGIVILFYLLMEGSWKKLLLLLLGFMIAKFTFLTVSQLKNKKGK